MFMFAVGYQLDLRLIRGRERVAASVSVSLDHSSAVARGLARRMAGPPSSCAPCHSRSRCSWARPCRSLRFLCWHASSPTADMHRTRIGSIALASAAIDDVLAWSLLALVVTIAGAGSQQFRLLLAPIYAARDVRCWSARCCAGWWMPISGRAGLRPTSSPWCWSGCCCPACATEWMGVKYIFGAFLFGVVMPRQDRGTPCARTSSIAWSRSASWCCSRCSSSCRD